MAKIKHYLIDLEGTVVEGKSFRPIPGVASWLQKRRRAGARFRLVTNNTTHTPTGLYRLLRRNGLEIRPGELISCLTAAKERLKKEQVNSCFVIGSRALKRFLRGEGLRVDSDHKVGSVVVGLDESLTLRKLRIALRAIRLNGARLIAMHKAALYVNEKGEVSLSSGAIVSALEYACGVKATVVGKPSRGFFRSCMKGWDVKPGEVMMISDDPLLDLRGAKRMGMKTAFVLTGTYRERGILRQLDGKLRPDLVVDTISEITM